jgi:uncharacterized protein (TIGR02391 family)
MAMRSRPLCPETHALAYARAMTIRWDDIDILRTLDLAEQEHSDAVKNGQTLMQAIAAQRGETVDPERDVEPFLHELLIMRAGGLIEYQDVRPSGFRRETLPADFLNLMWHLSLTIAGRDRARGRVVLTDPPDPAEDDGRPIWGSTLETVARSIGNACTDADLQRFLIEARIQPDWVPEFEGGTKWIFVYSVLDRLAGGPSPQRRQLRSFLGAWLEDRLHSGPSEDQREALVEDLARQGWFITEGRLVIGDPVFAPRRKEAGAELPARLQALHPLILAASQGLFDQQHRSAAILQAFVAVAQRVKTLSDLHTDGVDLMARAFALKAPVLVLADLSTETGRNIQMGYHHIFMGTMAAMRNPNAHELFGEIDEDEALEQLAIASLLMRRLDEVEHFQSEPSR